MTAPKFTGSPLFTPTAPNSGDVITVNLGTVAAQVTAPKTAALTVTVKDVETGGTTTFKQTVTGVSVHPVAVQIQSISLDGVAGTVAADGSSATVPFV